MKYLLVLGVVLFALWLWRHNREAESRERDEARAQRQPKAAPALADMVACAHCGLHVPRGEAVAGDGHLYCCHAHRQAHTA